jgi:hypothetical protein
LVGEERNGRQKLDVGNGHAVRQIIILTQIPGLVRSRNKLSDVSRFVGGNTNKGIESINLCL